MTREQMIANFKLRLGADETVPSDAVIGVYLDDAEEMVRECRRYKSEDTPTEVKYHSMICRVAIDLYAMRGVENETGHSENGVVRSYEDIHDYISKEVMQIAGGF